MTALAVQSLGLASTRTPSLADLCAHLNLRAPLDVPPLDAPAADRLTALALTAVHQAFHRASLVGVPPERLGILCLTAFGAIDPTLSFLDSMLDQNGKYASPRHFTRSVYAGVTSQLAIHFKIHGPCETLAHDQYPILGLLDRAAVLLATGRVDALIACWADQTAPIVQDLARRSTEKLHRQETRTYAEDPPAEGAVALVLRRPDPAIPQLLPQLIIEPAAILTSSARLPDRPENFPTANAISLLQTLLQVQHGRLPEAAWTEISWRRQTRAIRIRQTAANKAQPGCSPAPAPIG